MLMIFCLKGVEKSWSPLVLRYEVDIASKLVDYQLGNDEAKTYAVGVDFFLFVLNRAKKLKQLVFILIFYANTVVHHRQPQELVRTVLHYDRDLSVTVSKFYRIWKKVQKYLLQPLDVRFD